MQRKTMTGAMELGGMGLDGAVGGNPWISVQFRSAGEEAIGCMQLSK